MNEDNKIGFRIKQLRSAKKLRQQDLAQLLHVSRSLVSLWEIGVAKPKMEELEEMANIFEVTTDYLLGRSRIVQFAPEALEPISVVDTVKIPIYSKLRGGVHILAIQEDNGTIEISRELASTSSCVSLRVHDNAMIHAGAVRGSIALVQAQLTVKDGDIAVVFVDEGEAVIRQIFYKGDMAELHTANPEYPTLTYSTERIKVYGKVLEFRTVPQ